MRVLIIAVLALIGYVECRENKHPYLVSIEQMAVIDTELIPLHICSGAIISEKLVLTLASCTERFNVVDMRVRAGTVSFERDGIVKSIDMIVPHEKYTSSRMDYDIAIVHIREPFTFNKDVKALKLPTGTDAPSVGSHATLTGWGVIDASMLLESVDLEMHVPIQCQNMYAPSMIYITDRMFCAGNTVRKTGCKTDPGSPLVSSNTLLGLSVLDVKCDRYPGIFTNVASLKKWINL
ncbi:PREDICTED: trypsin 3A1-like isoform X1 [Nicrophorus vespilloides]|uniref:Trypsin 3A1-like isoform X1 n=1 Tax=Nicrophorus vespilloides TaxID=110193 RepID=A0ABM1M4I6_NICVS|nr:PREDICTED: trypsin 3A1-like isoform X1 [Nicrophorus vespilloides]